ncbi:MAG TPA: leucyl aminopeptidase [Lutibacter sp.]|nr:leucyl aminopeptidase [Lutibacter sp.]
MKLIKIKSLQKVQNTIFLADKITDLKKDLSSENFNYFKKYWKDEDMQYVKGTTGYTFVVKTEKKDLDTVRRAAFSIHDTLKKHYKVATVLGVNSKKLVAFAEGFLLSDYQFLKYFKDADKKQNTLEKLQVLGDVSQKELKELQNLIESVYWARDMVNEPVSFMDAIQLANEIKVKGKASDYKVEILGKGKIETLKMGGLLAVNQGSEIPPTFTIIEYKPKNAKNKKPIVLVGKGVVYDTGGLSLKPTAHSMDLMKSDMGGAATMSATIDALAKNKVPVYIIGLIPATDNRPGKTAYAPGDVVTMYDGTTIEVLNTDAEGRMLLADALAYANKYKPELVIDAATLTGAAVRALGTKTAISMGNAKDTYFKKLYMAGQETHDRVFRMPFWDEWKSELKSDIADMKNLGGPNAGMITAGKFLEHFVKYPYIHIDIAGPAFLETADSYNGKGGTGAGVRLLYQFLKDL